MAFHKPFNKYIKAKDINKTEFSDETKLKLDIFRKCFREWYPVFVHNKYTTKLFIFDMFAGSGQDTKGCPGSPLILLQEARGGQKQYCKQFRDKRTKQVSFIFNEKDISKSEELKRNIQSELNECAKDCAYDNCVFSDSYSVNSNNFKDIIEFKNIRSILDNPDYGKFILLDQYGFKEIDEDTFLTLVNAPKTDFRFFIASSFIKRFKNTSIVAKYFKTNSISFDDTKPKECHRVITDYYKSLIPPNKEYYLHTFTIQKNTNYYGLIFGTNHSLGMEKFVKVCWKEDPLAGESNCNINDDFEEGTLFNDSNKPTKKQQIFETVENGILEGHISDNIQGLKFVLQSGCEPKLFVDVVEKLLKINKIHIDGKFNRTATNIHKAQKYKILII